MSEIGKPVNRVDGRLKVTGGAQYAAEYPLKGVVHAVFVPSRIARGQITRIDTSAARKAPGVLAVLTHENIPKLAQQPQAFGEGGLQAGMSFSPLQTPEIFYAGQHIASVVAETLEQAKHAATLVDVSYRTEKPIIKVSDPNARLYKPKAIMGGGVPGRTKRGDPQRAIANAPTRIEATYTISTCHHNPMEPSATIAQWNGDVLTLYESTQGVTNTQLVVARQLGIPKDKVRVITNFLGGATTAKEPDTQKAVSKAQAAREQNIQCMHLERIFARCGWMNRSVKCGCRAGSVSTRANVFSTPRRRAAKLSGVRSMASAMRCMRRRTSILGMDAT